MTSSASTSRSPAEPLRVGFLVEELGRSGGMAVVRRYARHLIEAGTRCSLVVCATKPDGLPVQDDGIPVQALAHVDEPLDVAVATWWTTAEALFELEAARRVLLLQNLEHRFYRDEERAERLGALGVLDLPVDFVVIASHMRALLERLRPDARCLLVRNGIDKAVFVPREARQREGPLRVLVEGQPTLWFKGMAEAAAAVRAMREPSSLTLAVHDPEDARAAGLEADRIEGGLPAEGMAALYAEHDVLLKLSRFEGSPLPPLEAFHVGVPCVVTPFTGSEDSVEHGVNALVVGFDDQPGTTAALDLLARDRALLGRLSEGALRTAAGWPDQAASAAAFAAALHELVAEPPPPPDVAHRRLARTRRLWRELAREDQRRDRVALEHTLSNLEAHGRAVAEWQALAEERLAMIHDLTGRLNYRIALRARKLVGRGDQP
jgi:glycosyltransferase involved in cell wall biosynthesis